MGLFDSSRALLATQASVTVLTCKRFGHRRVSTPGLPRSLCRLSARTPEKLPLLPPCRPRERRGSESGQRWLRGTTYRGRRDIGYLPRGAAFASRPRRRVLSHIDPFDPYERLHKPKPDARRACSVASAGRLSALLLVWI